MKTFRYFFFSLTLGLTFIQCESDNSEKSGPKISFTFDDGSTSETFDVVVANILAGPLAELAPQICGYLRSGGMLALSGILEHQADDLIDTYEPWIEFAPAARSKEWICLSGKKR